MQLRQEMQHGCQRYSATRRGRILAVLLGGMMGPFALVQDAPAQTWSERTSNTVEHLVDVIFTSGNTAVAVGTITVAADDNVTVSSDGGSSWTGYAPTPGPENLSAVFSSASTAAMERSDYSGSDQNVVRGGRGGGQARRIRGNSSVRSIPRRSTQDA